MYLKRLDIQGFKSFPDKIKLDFNKGITAVVGPNGSGKSNISDAVRWVLGEQSAKSLRGAKMEDIIFAGTQNRRPLNFAEVCITLDNYNHEIALDYSEVTVSRRVYRSGESEFLINGTVCRLKDIHELFMDTGIGREGYSIIGQGKIDEILSSKSEDRRLLFEEAVGIGKFKNRRQEAEIKLEKEKQNLIRVNDIIAELELQIQPLFEQAEKAKKYLLLNDRIKLLHINLFLIESNKIDEVLMKSTVDFDNLQAQIDKENGLLENEKNKFLFLKQELATIENTISSFHNEVVEVRSGIEKKEHEIKIVEEQIQYNHENIKRTKAEIEKKEILIAKVNDEKKLLEVKQKAVEVEIFSKGQIVHLKQSEFDLLNEKLSENEGLIENYNGELIEKIRVTSDIKSNINRISAILEQLNSRENDIINEKQYNSSQIHDKSIHVEALEKQIQENEEKEQVISAEINKSISKRQAFIEQVNNLKEEINLSSLEINENFSKYKVLSEMEKEHEGFYKSVKAVLKQKENHNPTFSGVCGAVGELLLVPKEYETPIEIALGSYIQNIITNTEEDAKSAIEFLKKNNLGRATFLPLSAVKGKEFASDLKETLLKEKGVMGIAKDLIGFDSKYDSIISSLLGRVIVLDNLTNAIAFSKKYHYTYKLVTVEGDLLNAGGSLTGGSMNKSSTNVFGRSREISELHSKIEALKIIFAEKNDNISVFENNISQLKEEIQKRKDEVQKIYIDKISLLQNCQQDKNIVQDLHEKNGDFEIEEKQLILQKNDATKNLNIYNESLLATEECIQDIKNHLDKFQSNVQDDRESKEMRIKELTDAKIALSVLEQHIIGIVENKERIDKDMAFNKTEIESLQRECTGFEESILERKEDIQKLQEIIIQLMVVKDDFQNKVNQLETDKKDKIEKISFAEESISEKSKGVSLLTNEAVRLQSKKENLENERQRIFDAMWNDYEITYQQAQKYPKIEEPHQQIQKEERDVKSQIRDLGNVNVNAVEEYKIVKERFDFLTTQKDDIINAEQKLFEVIKELTGLMEKQFQEQFKVISENFSYVFAEMFGGGQAYLQLSNDSDILNAGIDIIAQPPGKTIKNMFLLSGGERALTAISLLFAIFKMKPSPFCILDEIEAALDEANVVRYANYLKNFSADTQFIVITHRKGTMEACDTLYGVTMHEQGVSKLVSVKFAEGL